MTFLLRTVIRKPHLIYLGMPFTLLWFLLLVVASVSFHLPASLRDTG